MRHPLARLAVVLASVFASVAVPAPPARAATLIDAVFFAEFSAIGGMGYSLFTLPTTSPQPIPDCLPLVDPLVSLPNCHVVSDHLRFAVMSSLVCVDLDVNAAKPDKDPAHVGNCGFFTVDTPKPGPPENTVTGHCDLAGGQVSMLYIDALGFEYLLDVHFTKLATDLVLTGHVTKLPRWQQPAQTGLLVGYGRFLPPQPVVTTGQSCFDKTAEDFLWMGSMTAFTV